MKNLKDLSTEKSLEHYRVALTNAESQPGVTKALEASGYDTETINQGKELLAKTRSVVDKCAKKRDIRNAAYDDFYERKEALNELFTVVRAKARLIYRNNPARIELLELNKNLKANYIQWIRIVKKFYSEVAADETIQQELARLKVTMEDINAGIALISEVDKFRAIYVKRYGESQDLTEMKKENLKIMKSWMLEFFGVARIGLRDNPQLLETLGKVVRS